jgi:hypothetical protein
VLELLLILAEIQKTDLARTEVDFVGIKGGTAPPLSHYQEDPASLHLNMNRKDGANISLRSNTL